MTIVTFKDLEVWKKAMNLVEQVYKLTSTFPQEEKYGLVSQMRRSVISIPSNIAEGKLRGSRKDYCRFLFNAFGSGGELETQLEIALRLRYVEVSKIQEVILDLEILMRMLNSLIAKLSEPKI